MNLDIECLLEQWIFKKNYTFTSIDDICINNYILKLVTSLLKRFQLSNPGYLYDKKLQPQIERYNQGITSINQKMQAAQNKSALKDKKSTKQLLFKSIYEDSLEYIFAQINDAMFTRHEDYFEMYLTYQHGLIRGTILEFTSKFHEIQLRLMLFDHLDKKPNSLTLGKGKIRQNLLVSKEVYTLKIKKLEQLLVLFNNKLSSLKEESPKAKNPIQTLELKILDYKNHIQSLKKEQAISTKPDASFPLKWKEFMKLFLAGNTESIREKYHKIDDNNLILLQARHNSTKKSFAQGIISPELFEESYIKLQLALIDTVENKI